MNAQSRGVASLFVSSFALIFAAFFLFLALLYGQGDLILLCTLLIALVIGTRVWAGWSGSRVDCRVLVDKRRLFPGETLTLRIEAENRKPLPVSIAVEVPARGLGDLPDNDRPIMEQGSLLWYQELFFRHEMKPSRRGAFQVGPLRVRSGDLFGFFCREWEGGEKDEVLVYPSLAPLKNLTFPRNDLFGLPGVDSPVKDPVYILGTTDYQHGRPARHIQWKASARHHRLQEKVFEPTGQEKVLFLVDVGRFAAKGAGEEFEKTLEVVAALAVREEKRGCAMGLVTDGAMTGSGSPLIPVSRNARKLPDILDALARLRMEPHSHILDLLQGWQGLSWGTNPLYFTFDEGGALPLVRQYLRGRHMSPLVFTWESSASSQGTVRPVSTAMNLLDLVSVGAWK